MLAVCVIALLCLVSVSHSAPPVCEDLIRPLDQLHHLEGTWALVAGSMNDTARMEKLRDRDSTRITYVNETSKMSYTLMFGFGGNCHYVNGSITFNGTGSTFRTNNLTVTSLHTSCPDCLVMYLDNESKTDARLHLFSRRREVDQKEMDDFKAQVECLNMPPPVEMDPNNELCLDHNSKDPAAQTKEEQTHDVSDLS